MPYATMFSSFPAGYAESVRAAAPRRASATRRRTPTTRPRAGSVRPAGARSGRASAEPAAWAWPEDGPTIWPVCSASVLR